MVARIDTRILYKRVPLPAEENAYSLWEEAAKLSVSGDLSLGPEECIACSLEGTLQPSPKADPVWPTDERGARLLVLIEENRPALELLDRGIERGRLQFPEIPSPEQFNVGMEYFPVWGNLCRLRSRRILYNVSRGDFAAAARDAIQRLRMADMICNGEGILIHYLLGTCLRGGAHLDLLHLARQDLPHSVAVDLLDSVEQSLAAEDGLVQAKTVDFFKTTVPYIEALPEHGNLESLVDCLLAKHFPNANDDMFGEVTDAPERFEWLRRGVLMLLNGHPLPFDKAATLDIMHRRFEEVITLMDHPWRPRLFDLRVRALRLMANVRARRLWRKSWLWPFQLTPACGVCWLGESEQARASLAELAETCNGKFRRRFQPTPHSELGLARRRIQQVRNPIGLMLAEHIAPDMTVRPIMLHRRASLEAVKATLAVRIFVARRGRLPSTFGELLAEGNIKSPPRDPFSNGALRYCPRRRIVWSIGENGTNRRGKLPHEAFAPGHVLRWEISQATA